MSTASNEYESGGAALAIAPEAKTARAVETAAKTGTQAQSTNKSAVNMFWITATLLAASIEPIIVKFGYAASCSPLQLLCLKSVVGGILIWPLTRQSVWVGKAGLRQILPAALLLLTTSSLAIMSLQYIQASMLITIITATPAMVALVNQALGRDQLGAKFWLGFFSCAGGLFLTLGSGFGTPHPLGIALAMAAVLSSTTYRVLMEKLTKNYKPAVVSSYIFASNGICMLPFLPFVLPGIQTQILASGVWLGFAAAIANVAFLYAISLLGSTRVSIISMLERPIVIVIASILLHETLSTLQITGIVMVIAGVQLAKVKRKS